MPTYSFRALAIDDFDMLRGWLRTPLVTQWWGDPDEQEQLLRGDIDDPRMVTRIVSLDGVPFAYAQDYHVHEWPQPHFVALPTEARAIDAFIGDPAMIGKGHGAGFLRCLASGLMRDGAPVVAIDPDVDNMQARRAYARAGFRFEREVDTDDGIVALMIFDADAAA